MPYCFSSSSPLTDWYLYTSANGEWHVAVYAWLFFFIVSINGLLLIHICKWRITCSRICLIVFSSSPLMDCHFYTSANEEWQVAVYTLLFFFIVSINGLLLLHIYKRRMGCEPYMPYGFPSLSPLTDCYLYTSANEEWACNRVCLMVSFPCLHWWIATSTHLQMKNEHVTVYALWFSFIVSINGLSLLHFCKWRTCM